MQTYLLLFIYWVFLLFFPTGYKQLIFDLACNTAANSSSGESSVSANHFNNILLEGRQTHEPTEFLRLSFWDHLSPDSASKTTQGHKHLHFYAIM